MIWEGFGGPSYKLESPSVSPEETINFYMETIERGPRTGKPRLRQIPGLEFFKSLPPGPIQALWPGVGRLFAVSAGQLWEIFQDATPSVSYGNVGNGPQPALIEANGAQLLVSSNGNVYISNGGPVLPVSLTDGTPLIASSIAFLDQYFIAGELNTNKVRISNLADGNIWDVGEVAEKEAYSDHIVRVWVDQPGGELLWLFSNDTYEVWQDTGGLFPFQRIQGAVFSVGCDSPFSVAGAKGFRFWLWHGVIYGASGLPFERVSDYGVEQAIKGYSYFDQTNAEAWCYIEGGHLFYAISFIEAGVTWVFDSAMKSWAKRSLWKNGQWQRYRPRVYAKQWGNHYVGDYASGTIWKMSPNVFTDAEGLPLRRTRVAPYITDEMKNQRYNRLTLDMDTGVGLNVDVSQLGYDPQVMMRYSTDRGKTWSDWRQESAGKIGETLRRVFFTQMGSSRIGLTVEISMDAPVGASINTAYIEIGRGILATQ